ncbi:MLO-like protein 4 isoform X2 [Magnolia sinica]|uniref:MLO-like protein 4 isoform X2 n=1 Tax=Magnolia sinica TaxID=86752 RepID=UPI0026594114|nr:MLO-like protein 4 isoform X2 [Magnolia sinica]
MGRSLAETPTWSVATVITALVAFGFIVQRSIQRFGKWLVKTKRKALLAALHKIKEELMLFGLLSLLLGHWTIWVAKICIKSSSFSSHFYPCAKESYKSGVMNVKHLLVDDFYRFNYTRSRDQEMSSRHRYCPEIHGWRSWESQARSMAIPSEQGSLGIDLKKVVIRRQSTFICHHTSHPWSQNKVLIWMLCFIRQFWSSINRADYLALRLGFITNHNLHLSYDFHNYMLRSMEEEFRDIVGISVPLWGYAITCMLVNIHGTNAYFWLSFIPAILILLVGTKLHHIVSQLALEAMNASHPMGCQLKPRDGLFWFGKPKLLLWLIQIISFQNAFEMATFIWSLWEIKGPSCFMKNRVFLIIRLVSGVVFQFWCSYNTFPLYVIITQMGSRFKKAVIAENIRGSLHGWLKRVKDKSRHDSHHLNLTTTRSNTSLESMAEEMDEPDNPSSGTVSGVELVPIMQEPTFVISDEIYEQPEGDDSLEVLHCSDPIYDHSDDGGDDGNGDCDDHVRNESCLLPPSGSV